MANTQCPFLNLFTDNSVTRNRKKEDTNKSKRRHMPTHATTRLIGDLHTETKIQWKW